MLELLVASLLPVAAASGWYAAKRHYIRIYCIDHVRLPASTYCRGLNYLLNEKTDEALDTFARLLEEDCEAIETRIALGNLFRRQGDVEKAIEIHEKLNRDPDLSETVKANASFELGVDYMRAGLFDRAETIFKGLSDSETRGKAALQQLLLLYQQEKDWRNAISCTRKLLKFSSLPRGENVAQFLCELAEEALASGALEKGLDYLAQALQEEPGCVRASLVKARWEFSQEDYTGALRTLHRVEQQNPAYLVEILELLVACHEHLGEQGKLRDCLGRLFWDFGLVEAAIVLSERILKEEGPRAAVDSLLAALEKKPSLSGLRYAVALLSVPGQEEGPSDMKRVAMILNRLGADLPLYRCRECGFSGTQLHWRCPSCQSWGSITPTS